MAFCAAGAALCALDWSGGPELFARQALCMCFVHADACLCGSGRRNALCAPTLGCVWQAQYFRLVGAERSAQLRGWRNTLRSCALVCTQRSAWAGAKARVGKSYQQKTTASNLSSHSAAATCSLPQTTAGSGNDFWRLSGPGLRLLDLDTFISRCK